MQNFIWRVNTEWKHLIDNKICGSEGVSVGYGKIPIGEYLPLHTHTPQEIYFVTKGTGILTMDGDKTQNLGSGDTVYIPGKKRHGITNTGNVDFEYLFIFVVNNWSDVKYDFQ